VTLGTLATALPGPQEIAACLIPASGLTPLACLEFLAKLEWTKWTISDLTGDWKTPGSGTSAVQAFGLVKS